jgi:hypothetical protein
VKFLNFLKSLNEEYAFRIGYAEIFKNPDTSEINRVDKISHGYIRFLGVPEHKEFYIWNGYKLLHYDVANFLGFYHINDGFYGIGGYNNKTRKIVIDDIDLGIYVKKQQCMWAEKYFENLEESINRKKY